MADEHIPADVPCYVISVAAKMVSLHPQTLRYYDRLGLIQPSRTAGRIRLYSRQDIERLRKIARLSEDLGVNLAGVEVILNMAERIERLQERLARSRRQAESEIQSLRERITDLESRATAAGPDDQVINVSAREVDSNPSKEDTDDRG